MWILRLIIEILILTETIEISIFNLKNIEISILAITSDFYDYQISMILL